MQVKHSHLSIQHSIWLDVAGGLCCFVAREKYYWLAGGLCCFVVREKYCWLAGGYC